MSRVPLSRLVMPLLAMLALIFLVAMVVIGAQPIQASSSSSKPMASCTSSRRR